MFKAWSHGAILFDLSELIRPDSECIGIALQHRRRQPAKYFRPKMAPDAPAPQTGALRQQRFIHARPVHVVRQRRYGTGQRMLPCLLRQLYEFIDCLTRDDFLHLPAGRFDQLHPSVCGARINRLAVAVECDVAFLRYVRFAHGYTTVRCMKELEKRPLSGTKHRRRSTRASRPLPISSFSMIKMDAEPVLPLVARLVNQRSCAIGRSIAARHAAIGSRKYSD